MTFSVEIRDIDAWRERKLEVEIYLDRESLSDLVRQLGGLRSAGDHCHFMTPTWGRHELTEERQSQANVLADHLRITLVE
jgi:hypothetical protein